MLARFLCNNKLFSNSLIKTLYFPINCEKNPYNPICGLTPCYRLNLLLFNDCACFCFVGDSPGVKVSPLQAAQDQALAQVIVFSLLQRQKHPEMAHHLIPNILISPEEFQIFMYDSVNDILVGSRPSKLFDDETLLRTESVVVLWLVLHYREFCQGIKISDRYGDCQSHFRERARNKWEVYSKLLNENVSSFPTVAERVELNQDLFDCSVEVKYQLI